MLWVQMLESGVRKEAFFALTNAAISAHKGKFAGLIVTLVF